MIYTKNDQNRRLSAYKKANLDTSAFASILVGSTWWQDAYYSTKRDKASKMIKEITKKNEEHFHSEDIVEYLANETINFLEDDIDLIMIGMLGKKSLEKPLLRSVAEKIIEKTPVSVKVLGGR